MALTTGQVATYIPELATGRPAGLRHRDCHRRRPGLRGRRNAPGCSPSSRSPSRWCTALRWRTAGASGCEQAIGVEPSRRRLQLDQPGARHGPAAEPDDQRRRDRHLVAGAGRRRCGAAGACDRCAVGLRRAQPLELDEAVFESERATGHRNRAIGHMLRNYGIVRGRPRAGAGAVLQAVLGAGRLPRPGADGGDAGQRRPEPGHRGSARCAASTSARSSA